MSNEKNYKTIFFPNMDVNGYNLEFSKYFETHKEAEAALSAIADYTLFLHEHKLMIDNSNSGLVMRFDGFRWIEIDEDENDI